MGIEKEPKFYRSPASHSSSRGKLIALKHKGSTTNIQLLGYNTSYHDSTKRGVTVQEDILHEGDLLPDVTIKEEIPSRYSYGCRGEEKDLFCMLCTRSVRHQPLQLSIELFSLMKGRPVHTITEKLTIFVLSSC
jgi:hypothetical protein